MTDNDKMKDLVEKVKNLRTIVETIDDKDLKRTLDFHLSRTEVYASKSTEPAQEKDDWDTFSYDKEKCIAP